MMCCGKERSVVWFVTRGILIVLGIAALVTLFGFIVMLLWNWLLPNLFAFHTITFWQAIGLVILSKILFGGFKCCNHHGHHDKMHRWHMSPEDREKLREEWRNRCCSSEKKEE